MTDYLSKKIKIVSYIAIICVVFQHAINFTGYIEPSSSYGSISWNSIFQYVIGYGFARIAVSLFFLLSGYLFFRNFTVRTYLGKLIKRVRTLLVPYLLWSSLGMVFVYILQSLPGLTTYFSSLYTGIVVNHPFGYYIQSVLHHGVSFQLWFLVDLMIYTLLAPLFYVVLKFSSLLFILPLFVVWLFQIPLPPTFSFLYRGGFFYLLGASIAISSWYVPKEKTKHMALLALLCWITMIAMKTGMAFGVIPSAWLSLPQIDNMTILMGIVSVWFGYDSIFSSKAVSFISLLTPFTFFIYASHEPLLEVVKRVGVGFLGYTEGSLFILYTLSIVVTLGICIGMGYLLKRFFPKLFFILTGGR